MAIIEMEIPSYLVKIIGKDQFVYGDFIYFGDKKSAVIPKFVLYKKGQLLKRTLKSSGKAFIGYDINSFKYGYDEESDKQFKKEIKRVEVLTIFQEKIEAIKSRYEKKRLKRRLKKDRLDSKFKSKFSNLNFIVTITSIIFSIILVNLTDLKITNALLLPVLAFFVSDFIVISELKRRFEVLEDGVENIMIEEEFEDRITAHYANVLRIYWKRKEPTVHLLITKEGYEKWIAKMKRNNPEEDLHKRYEEYKARATKGFFLIHTTIG